MYKGANIREKGEDKKIIFHYKFFHNMANNALRYVQCLESLPLAMDFAESACSDYDNGEDTSITEGKEALSERLDDHIFRLESALQAAKEMKSDISKLGFDKFLKKYRH